VIKYVVTSPEKVKLLHFGGAFRLVKDAAREVNAEVAINFGYFGMSDTHPIGSWPVGQAVLDGKNVLLTDATKFAHFHGVYRKDGAVKCWDWLPADCDWGIRAGPRLLEAGAVCERSISDSRWPAGGVSVTASKPRVAIGVRADGQVVLAYWDATTMRQAAADMLSLGCIDALAGDGGGSASWYCPETGDAIGERVVPNCFVVDAEAPANRKVKVYLSPSQQPDNIGVGDFGDEQTAMRRVAFITATRLSFMDGVDVAVARTGLSLPQVVAESNAWGASVHICLHSNASVNHDAVGCEVFYHPGSTVGERLARRVYGELSHANPHGGHRCEATGFYELKWTDAPAVYIEMGFHDNAEEAKWIRRDAVHIAKLIAAAVCDEFIKEE
jgi:N-acetylmuramoyl-L-alanine amidase